MSELADVLMVFVKPFVDYIAAGGSPLLAMLAAVGVICIMASVIRDSGKTLGVLFVVVIAAPWLLIEYLWKKHKRAN